MRVLSPLEAFHTDLYLEFDIFPISFLTLSLSSLSVLGVMLGLYFLMFISFFEYTVVSYSKLRDFFIGQVPTHFGTHFISLVFIFVFIGMLNLVALVPNNASFTAQLVVNLLITTSIVVGSIFMGLNLRGIKFLLFFFPSNVPVFIRPLLFIIEMLSFIMRTFSMSIRLFANMVAGHSLLHILHSFQLYIAHLGVGSSVLIIGGIAVVLLGYGWLAFEIFVAFSQAYVFGLLYSSYISDLSKF